VMQVSLAYAERQLRHWTKKVEELRLTSNGVKHKEKGKGKENIPPAPPIEKREIQEKAAATTTRVRVREEFVPPSREASAKYAKSKKIPELFVDYWLQCMETNYSPAWYDAVNQRYIVAWRRSLITFWNNAESDKAWLRYKAEHEADVAAKPRKYSASEWSLCAERCRHFDAKLCRCGCDCAIPPQFRPLPQPPEECAKYESLVVASR